MAACGLDFGTSNTTLGHLGPSGPALLPLEGAHRTVPSAIFFEPGLAPEIGRAATQAYVEGRPGRLMRGLKSVLGTPLMEETTPLGRERLRLRDVIGRYLAAVKARAEAAAGEGLDTVVHGRPVHFVDGDPAADRRAQDALHAIAREVGFREISFQYEPIAAALDYERGVASEEIALIADIGGGTSDFSIVRLSPERRGRPDRAGDILANDGVRIGGTDFDRRLSLGTVMPLLGLGSAMRRGDLAVPSAYYHDLATWSAINRLYNGRTRREIDEVVRDCARPDLVGRLRAAEEGERGHALAGLVEGPKIAASQGGAADIDLGLVEPGLAARVDRSNLAAQTADLALRVAARVGCCLAQAGIAAEAVNSLFLTGGSTGRAVRSGAPPRCGWVIGSVTTGAVPGPERPANRRRHGVGLEASRRGITRIRSRSSFESLVGPPPPLGRGGARRSESSASRRSTAWTCCAAGGRLAHPSQTESSQDCHNPLVRSSVDRLFSRWAEASFSVSRPSACFGTGAGVDASIGGRSAGWACAVAHAKPIPARAT